MAIVPLNECDNIKSLVLCLLGDADADRVADELIMSFLHDKQYRTFVEKRENRCIAFVTMKCDPFEGSNGVGEIVFLAVKPSRRREGVGRSLVRFLENYAGAQEFRKLYVLAGVGNVGAVCFWVKQGYAFEARMRDFTLPGIDNYYLGKNLPKA